MAVQYFILSIVQILKKDEHNLLVNALDLILKISLKVCLFLSQKKKLRDQEGNLAMLKCL